MLYAIVTRAMGSRIIKLCNAKQYTRDINGENLTEECVLFKVFI